MGTTSAGVTADNGGFRIGNTLSRSFGVFGRHVAFFALITLVTQLPNLLVQLNIRTSTQYGMRPNFGTLFGEIMLAALILTPFSQTIVYHAAFQDMLGRPVRFGESFAIALRRFFPLLGTLICLGVILIVGFALLVVPGIIFMLMLSLAVPACVVERIGPFASLRRSASLTKGYRWRIFGLALLVIVVSLVIGAMTSLLSRALGPQQGVLASYLVNGVIGAFYSVLVAVVYHDLRGIKEGIGTDRIAAVFD